MFLHSNTYSNNFVVIYSINYCVVLHDKEEEKEREEVEGKEEEIWKRNS